MEGFGAVFQGKKHKKQSILFKIIDFAQEMGEYLKYNGRPWAPWVVKAFVNVTQLLIRHIVILKCQMWWFVTLLLLLFMIKYINF